MNSLEGFQSHIHSFSLEETIDLLNDELSILGLTQLNESLTQSNVLDTLLKLINLQKKNVRTINDLESANRLATSDKDRFEKALDLQREQNRALQQSNAQAKERERKATSNVAKLAKSLQNEKEEKKKLFQAMQYKEKLFLHESRKREREFGKFKEYLQQVEKGDSSLINPKIEIVNDLKKIGGRRSTWSNLSSSLTKEEEALYSVVVSNFGERQRQLLADNAILRQSLGQLKQRIESILKTGCQCHIVQNGRISETESSQSERDQFQLPLDFISLNDFEKCLEKARKIVSGLDPEETTTATTTIIHSEEVVNSGREGANGGEAKDLTQKIKLYEETIERQAKMIESMKLEKSSQDELKKSSTDEENPRCCGGDDFTYTSLDSSFTSACNCDGASLIGHSTVSVDATATSTAAETTAKLAPQIPAATSAGKTVAAKAAASRSRSSTSVVSLKSLQSSPLLKSIPSSPQVKSLQSSPKVKSLQSSPKVKSLQSSPHAKLDHSTSTKSLNSTPLRSTPKSASMSSSFTSVSSFPKSITPLDHCHDPGAFV